MIVMNIVQGGSDRIPMFVEFNMDTAAFSHETLKQVGWVANKRSLAQFHVELARKLRVHLTQSELTCSNEL